MKPRSSGLLDGIKATGGTKLKTSATSPVSAGKPKKSKTCAKCATSFTGFGDTCSDCRKKTRPAANATDKQASQCIEFPIPDNFSGVRAELFTDPTQMQRVNVGIHNARHISNISIGVNGFELIEHQTSLARDDFLSEDKIKGVYYKEVCDAVRKKTGATRVICASHKCRLSGDVDYANGQSGYAHMVHADMSSQLGWANTRQLLSVHGLKTSDTSRYQWVNMWRNINDTAPILDNTLATCDIRSVANEDIGGTSSPLLTHKPGQRWCYFPHMVKQEALIFMHWDSARLSHRPCFHTAFSDPSAPADAPPRESVEARLLVVYDQARTCSDGEAAAATVRPEPGLFAQIRGKSAAAAGDGFTNGTGQLLSAWCGDGGDGGDGGGQAEANAAATAIHEDPMRGKCLMLKSEMAAAELSGV